MATKAKFDKDAAFRKLISMNAAPDESAPVAAASIAKTRKRVNLVLPADVYADVQKIAQVRLTSVSEIVSRLLTEYVARNQEALEEYDALKAKSQEKS